MSPSKSLQRVLERSASFGIHFSPSHTNYHYDMSHGSQWSEFLDDLAPARHVKSEG
jgi:hypothetical protein